MEIFQKARALADSGRYDSCGPKTCEIKIESGLGGIYNAKSENQNCKLFKTLMTNSCNFDCKYCANPKCKHRVSYESEELARLFMHLNKNAGVNGLFLSSGIAGDPDRISEKMLEAVRSKGHLEKNPNRGCSQKVCLCVFFIHKRQDKIKKTSDNHWKRHETLWRGYNSAAEK